MKSTILVSVHGEDCVGCVRGGGKPIMLSLDGNNSKGEYVFLDAFLSNDGAKQLIQDLKDIMIKNKGDSNGK